MLPLLLSPEDSELVLTLDLQPGENADAVIAAETLIAWVAAIREANAVMDPHGSVAVDLISADAACLRLRTILRFIEDKALGIPADALAEFPKIKKLVSATVLAVPAGLMVAGAGLLILPDATVNLSPEGTKRFLEEQAKVQAASQVHQKVQTVYKTLSKDRAITRLSVSEGVSRPPLISIPRAEFAERGGLWERQEMAPQERPQQDIWDVVVTYPAMKSTPLSWGFERDGLPFNAKMADESFLRAIRDGTLPIVIQEGVHMRVEVDWIERLQGQVWEPVPRTRKIVRVLSPRPNSAPPGALPLFGQK